MIIDWLYREFKDKLVRYAASILKNSQTAEDIVQEAFLNMLKNEKTLRKLNQKQCTVYAFQTVKHACLNHLRRQPLCNSQIDTLSFEIMAKNIDEELIARSKDDKLLQAIRLLNEKEKDFIMLFYFDDLSYAQIAKIWSKSITSVYMTASRARKKLKKFLKESEDEL